MGDRMDVIRDKPFNSHFASRPTEIKLAKSLGECFSITHGDSRGGLSYWLAEPNDLTRERFGLTQEVLVLYSPHKRNDARILTMIENLGRNPDFRNRIDKVAVILIYSNEEGVRDLISGQYNWVIVPFSEAELLDAGRGPMFIRSRLSDSLGAVDLFGMSSPIEHDKYLFGRDTLVQSLITRSTQSAENNGLFGLRKTGKTSVLFAIRRRLNSSSTIVHYVDCQNPGYHSSRWWRLLEIIRNGIIDYPGRDTGGLTVVEGNYTELNAGRFFSTDLTRILAATEASKIVLILDEIEYITPNLSGQLGRHWDLDYIPFFQTIRALHHESSGAVTFIVAGVNPAGVEQTHFGVTPNPIFQLATPHFLEPLEITAVRDMVRTIGKYAGLSFVEGSYEYLRNRFGGHPYLIRLACSEVWRQVPTRDPGMRAVVTPQSFDGADRDILSRISQPIRDVLLSLVWWYPDEYDLLMLAATGEQEFVRDYLEHADSRAVQFVRYGLLHSQTGEFAIPDIRNFLVEHGEQYKRDISPFKRGDIPPNLLPEIPDIEALGDLFKRKSALEVKLRRLIIMYLGVQNSFDATKMAKSIVGSLKPRADRKSPADLFVGRTPQDAINELYLADFKNIICDNWQLFGNLFEANRSRFEMNIDCVNRARKYDSHSKPLPLKALEEFNNSYIWFEARLSAVPDI